VKPTLSPDKKIHDHDGTYTITFSPAALMADASSVDNEANVKSWPVSRGAQSGLLNLLIVSGRTLTTPEMPDIKDHGLPARNIPFLTAARKFDWEFTFAPSADRFLAVDRGRIFSVDCSTRRHSR
jgi:hypothetical protein